MSRLGLVSFLVNNSSQNRSVSFVGDGVRLDLSYDDWRKLFPMLSESYWSLSSYLFFQALSKNGLDLPSGSLIYDRIIADLLVIFPIDFPLRGRNHGKR